MQYGILNWWWGESSDSEDLLREKWVKWMFETVWKNPSEDLPQNIELEQHSDGDYGFGPIYHDSTGISDEKQDNAHSSHTWNPMDGKFLAVKQVDSEGENSSQLWFAFERRYRFSVQGESARFQTIGDINKTRMEPHNLAWIDRLMMLEWARTDIYSRKFGLNGLKELSPLADYGDVFAYSEFSEKLFMDLLKWDTPMNKFFYTPDIDVEEPILDEKGARKLWIEFVQNNFVCVIQNERDLRRVAEEGIHLMEFWPDLPRKMEEQEEEILIDAGMVEDEETGEMVEEEQWLFDPGTISLDRAIFLHPRLVQYIIRSFYIDGTKKEVEALDWFLKDITESGMSLSDKGEEITPFTQFLVNLHRRGKI